MKLYKFRPLGNESDLMRAKQIIETGYFWCSKFSELNDPMEGSFSTTMNSEFLDGMRDEKNQFKICSFSGKKAFLNPSIWGYYANGFKGLVIEIEVKLFDDTERLLKKVKISDTIPEIDTSISDEDNARVVLMSKSKYWKKEDEYRFLVKSIENYHTVGKITAIYFGNPYGRAVHQTSICNETETLQEFKKLRDTLRKQIKNIPCYLVKTDKSGINSKEPYII